MDDIIIAVKDIREYEINNANFNNIIYYAAAIVVIDENKDDLERLLHKYNARKQHNMVIFTSMTISATQ